MKPTMTRAMDQSRPPASADRDGTGPPPAGDPAREGGGPADREQGEPEGGDERGDAPVATGGDGAASRSRTAAGLRPTERPAARPPARWVGFVVRAVVGLLILFVAFSIFGRLVATRPEPARNEDAAVAPAVPVVRTVPVAVARTWTGYGTVRAVREVDLPARVAAVVEWTSTEAVEGVRTQPGRVLVRLDASDYEREAEVAAASITELEAALEQLAVDEASLERRAELARAQVRLAERERDRVAEVVASGVGRDRELDAAESALIVRQDALAALESELARLPSQRASLRSRIDAQESRLALARLNVERCTIAAPGEPGAAGWSVAAVDVEVGESVVPGRRVLRLVDAARIEVPLRIAAAARDEIRTGDEVTVRPTGTPAGDARPRRATVVRIAPDDDPGSRTTTVWVELEQDPDDPAMLAPGRFVRGEIRSRDRRPRTVVPRSAVDRQRILVVEDGVLVSRTVEPAFTLTGPLPGGVLAGDGPWTVLRETLPADTLVVIDPGSRRRDGERVEPVVRNAAAGEGAGVPAAGDPAR